MRIQLVSVDPFSPTLEFQVKALPAVIGRENGVEIRIDDRWISHPHCELIGESGGLRIRNLNSNSRTLVNDRAVKKSARLHSGDILTLGVRSLKVTWDACLTDGSKPSNKRKKSKPPMVVS